MTMKWIMFSEDHMRTLKKTIMFSEDHKDLKDEKGSFKLDYFGAKIDVILQKY